MTSATPTVWWICVEPMLVEAAAAMLEDSREAASSAQLTDDETRSGRIGLTKVIVARLSARVLHAGDMWATLQNFAASLPPSGALVITGCVTGQPLDASPGDVLISPSSGGIEGTDSLTATNILQRAIGVLSGEVGKEGYWLSSNLPHEVSSAVARGSSRAMDGSERDTPSSVRLHYLQDLDTVKGLMGWDGSTPSFKDNKTPTIVILGVNTRQSTRSDVLDTNSSRNVASYTKELIQLIANPSLRTIPCLMGTEKVVPARPAPQLPPFPPYRYPTFGNTVLLVIPTENKRKKSIFQECIVDRAPAALKVQTITVPVESDVGEQPYNDAGAAGAYNRIKNALERLNDTESTDIFAKYAIGTVLVASIENYIQTRDVERPADFGIAVVHNTTTGQTCACSSRGVTVSPDYVSRARRFGNDGDDDHGSITVGQVLAARVPGLDKADWHAVVAGKSRYDLLREAIGGLSIPW